jgi:hypothetical protein
VNGWSIMNTFGAADGEGTNENGSRYVSWVLSILQPLMIYLGNPTKCNLINFVFLLYWVKQLRRLTLFWFCCWDDVKRNIIKKHFSMYVCLFLVLKKVWVCWYSGTGMHVCLFGTEKSMSWLVFFSQKCWGPGRGNITYYPASECRIYYVILMI